MTEAEYKIKCIAEGLGKLLIVIPKLNVDDSKKLDTVLKNIETTLDFINDKDDRNKW